MLEGPFPRSEWGPVQTLLCDSLLRVDEGFELREIATGSPLILHFVGPWFFGDDIFFMRFVPVLVERGASVVLVVPPELARLAYSLPCVAEIEIKIGPPLGEARGMNGFYMPLLRHPDRMRLADIPAPVPYLAPDDRDVERWGRELAGDGRLKVGIAWLSGTPDPFRRIAPEMLRPLFDVQGVRWFSLQVPPPDAGLVSVPPGGVTDLSPRLVDFAETAAVMANLDLIISVDTAVMHLAGATGRPCWVLLPFLADWRWRDDQSAAPWYPSLRFFRYDWRQSPGWDGVVAQVREALVELTAVRRAA